jgi:hypothetical protein
MPFVAVYRTAQRMHELAALPLDAPPQLNESRVRSTKHTKKTRIFFFVPFADPS